jgi:hypothetical protein
LGSSIEMFIISLVYHVLHEHEGTFSVLKTHHSLVPMHTSRYALSSVVTKLTIRLVVIYLYTQFLVTHSKLKLDPRHNQMLLWTIFQMLHLISRYIWWSPNRACDLKWSYTVHMICNSIIMHVFCKEWNLIGSGNFEFWNYMHALLNI